MTNITIEQWLPNDPDPVKAIRFRTHLASDINGYLQRTYDSVYLVDGRELSLENPDEFFRKSNDLRRGTGYALSCWFLRTWQGNRCATRLIDDGDFIILWNDGDVTVKTDAQMQVFARRGMDAGLTSTDHSYRSRGQTTVWRVTSAKGKVWWSLTKEPCPVEASEKGWKVDSFSLDPRSADAD